VAQNSASVKREGYPLRPELVESAMYLYRATRDPFLINLGEDMLESIEFSTKTVCGYATVKVILAKLVNLLIIYWHVTHG
jgi:mannosidase alpha-like ER degradation enhancer 2